MGIHNIKLILNIRYVYTENIKTSTGSTVIELCPLFGYIYIYIIVKYLSIDNGYS